MAAVLDYLRVARMVSTWVEKLAETKAAAMVISLVVGKDTHLDHKPVDEKDCMKADW